MLRYIPLVLALAACGTDQRYLIDAPEVAGSARVRVATLEVREVSLPSYAEASEILLENADGGLTPVKNAVWADDPVRAVTLAIAEQVSARSSATAAPEPWPLDEDAQAAVSVTVAKLVAQANGSLRMSGQYAISSYDRVVAERIVPFSIVQPLASTGPNDIAVATGAAVSELSSDIIATLGR
ncbi:ABC-type transport auxiliary lipoprotein family protein [Salipiger sp. 1_MG-2023]|uniref:PqiC family protein n=1 Tax=Salipiger sp. 1_MG-2023 TaxID=3062665 RepID=UPI0026E3F7C8|nr:ABC-type transport auxiliary lipoprotein family protein [Salipiger sp. 1_MG-2023]MDO6584983.1 ABC-type transport auxiliary lipoprotein family protein [Salipiger sp. 1_MG-2023]